MWGVAPCLSSNRKLPQLESPSQSFRLHENMIGIAPDEVRGVAVGNDDADVAAVRVGCDQASETAPVRIPPAVQNYEPGTIGIKQQMVEVMFDAGLFVGISPNLEISASERIKLASLVSRSMWNTPESSGAMS